MSTTTLSAPTVPDQDEPPFIPERVLTLLGGALLGGAVMALIAFVGLARSRRTRAAADAEIIRRSLQQLADVARIAAEEALPTPKPLKPAYPDERLRNFTRGLILGLLGGAVYGLATARRRGADERQHWRASLVDLAGETRAAVMDYTAWGADDSVDVDRLTLREHPVSVP
ncbi:MAG: hypothetical protein IT340_00700 [Chloroflexi bacterium]|nr:hypothetical protein [Chloroflexota bacterium]